VKVTRAAFLKLAEAALAGLPKKVRGLLYNVEIAVRDSPGREAGKWKGSSDLLGLYTGLKRADMTSTSSGAYMPARILLYKRNIESRCADEAALAKCIRDTLLHEIGHHLGFDEAGIRRAFPSGR
jgi:predicted Zn-dependent protease with MMP-like domain